MPPNEKFDVYVEGVRDGSAAGIARAAQALAPRLSMPTERVAKLLAGRFRVRTGVDEDIGRKLVSDLEAFGLRVVIVPQGAKPGVAAAPPAAKPVPAPPRPAAPPAASRSTLPAPPPAPAAPASAPAPMPVEDADGGISIGGLELMGNETPAPQVPSAPPALAPQGFMPSSIGPPPEDDGVLELASPAPAKPAAPKPATAAPPPPADPFAPPDSPADHSIDLDVATPKARTIPPARRTGNTIPPGAAASQSQPSMAAVKLRQRVGEARAHALRGGLIVLVLAVAAGWFPGHLYAKHVDETKVVELQKEYRQLEVNPWKGEAIKRTKDKVREEINEVRWNAMLLMIGIWAACSGLLAALAYVLF